MRYLLVIVNIIVYLFPDKYDIYLLYALACWYKRTFESMVYGYIIIVSVYHMNHMYIIPPERNLKRI